MNDNLELEKLKLTELNAQLKYHDTLYYNKDAPEITDADYDQLKYEKKILLEKYPHLILYDDYQNNVGSKPDSRFQKVIHKEPMLSLDNAFNIGDVEKFILKVKRFLNMKTEDNLEFVCEPKIDGLSFSVIYKNGNFYQASTRGDGRVGEDVTHNVVTLKGLPKFLKDASELLEIRGEIYISHDDFAELNKDNNFANPRNAAAGSIRQLNSKVAESRNLKYFVYSIIDSNHETQKDVLDKLKKWGFCVNNEVFVTDEITEIVEYYGRIYMNRCNLNYDIDGVIYKVNNIALQKKLGSTNRAPRWAIAHKFPGEEGKTRLNKISIQVGRTGVLTPVAELAPINIGGVIVSRASLHNQDEIERKDIREGDYVIVKRAGDVIPQIIDVDKTLRSENSERFIFPNVCPVCQSCLEKIEGEVAVRCTGELFCRAQILQKIEHFVSRDAFNIVGLGEKQIEFFHNRNLINSPEDIFVLKEKVSSTGIDLAKCCGWGKKSVDNLFQAIENSKNITLDRFIFALGIRLVGKNVAKLLAGNYLTHETWYSSMVELSKTDNDFLVNIDGIGSKIVKSLKTFFSEDRNVSILNNLKKHLNIIDFQGSNNSSTSSISGKVIVFTGTLLKMSRAEAKSIAEKLGAKISSSLSSNTDFLIVGDNPGSKYTKAQELKVTIMNEDQWLKLVSEER